MLASTWRRGRQGEGWLGPPAPPACMQKWAVGQEGGPPVPPCLHAGSRDVVGGGNKEGVSWPSQDGVLVECGAGEGKGENVGRGKRSVVGVDNTVRVRSKKNITSPGRSLRMFKIKVQISPST